MTALKMGIEDSEKLGSAALRLTFSQTAVASCRYRTDRQLLRQRAMERAHFILPIVNLTRLCSERAPVWRLLVAAASDYFPFRVELTQLC